SVGKRVVILQPMLDLSTPWIQWRRKLAFSRCQSQPRFKADCVRSDNTNATPRQFGPKSLIRLPRQAAHFALSDRPLACMLMKRKDTRKGPIAVGYQPERFDSVAVRAVVLKQMPRISVLRPPAELPRRRRRKRTS